MNLQNVYVIRRRPLRLMSMTELRVRQGVKWIVMTDNPLLSIIQLEKFRVAMGAHHMMSHGQYQASKIH